MLLAGWWRALKRNRAVWWRANYLVTRRPSRICVAEVWYKDTLV